MNSVSPESSRPRTRKHWLPGVCTDLPGGEPEELYRSLSGTLRNLDDRTIVLPGHNYAPVPSATIGEQKISNPFLACASLTAFLRMTGGRLGL